MADAKLERMAAALRAEAEKNNTNTRPSGGDGATYAFWNIPENQTATVRFLPDADDDNLFFWSEKQTIRLEFPYAVGCELPEDKIVAVTVPCVDMFGDTCPIIAETRPWWKDDAKKELARKYYKKRTYIFQGFVVSSPMEEANVPENPIRRFMFGKTLMDIIKESLVNPEMEFLPTDYVGGRDFKITRTRKGDFANYGTSQWSFRTRSLTEAEQIAIDKYGLSKLSDFKGQRPDADAIAAIKAMFHASLAGEPYDFAAFGTYYRPFGVGNAPASATTEQAAKPASKPAEPVETEERVITPVKEEAAPAAQPAAPGGKASAAELIAKLREKTAAGKA